MVAKLQPRSLGHCRISLLKRTDVFRILKRPELDDPCFMVLRQFAAARF